LIEKARGGKQIVRLKGGDPFIFGRGGEEAETLSDEGIPFEIIPGVTSAGAALTYAGIPLTHVEYSSSIGIISGHKAAVERKKPGEWKAISCFATLVVLMGRKNLELITKRLIKNGKSKSTPAALVMNGTMVGQKTVTGRLDNIAALAVTEKIKSPVILVVGKVVKLKDKLDWLETKPLFARRVLVTRTTEQAGSFSEVLSDMGAEPVEFPTIKIVAPESYSGLDRAIKKLSSYDYLILTSVNGVKYFFERLYKLGKDVRELKGVKICAIGPMTAALIEAENIKVDIVPKEFRAEAVLKTLGAKRIKGKKFLLPRAEVAREILPKEIKRLGGTIDVRTAYKTIAPKKDAELFRKQFLRGNIDVVTFTSSSTVKNFVKIFGAKNLPKLLKKTRVACIGPITADTAMDFGIDVDIMPKDYTVPALAKEIEDYYATL
jgi:uroporphyrinogen III methyltransferase/synthase